MGKLRGLVSSAVGYNLDYVGCMTVDPGLMGTGWHYAALRDRKCLPNLICGGVLHASGDRCWTSKAYGIAEAFDNMVREFTPVVVVFEIPQIWMSSAKSIASAGRGDLFKLTFLIGCMAHVVYQYRYETVMVTPGEWKGQLPKDVVKKRIKAQFGRSFGDHEADAVGMLLAIQDML